MFNIVKNLPRPLGQGRVLSAGYLKQFSVLNMCPKNIIKLTMYLYAFSVYFVFYSGGVV